MGQGASGSAVSASNEGFGPSGGFFEGTEKRIELDFTQTGDVNLLKVPDADWGEVVRLSQTQILNTKKTSAFTSFLLSESSLIVYPQKVILKTCGRTVPLNSVEKILSIAKGFALEPEWLCFSRKNLMAPGLQPAQHQSTEAEVEQCKRVTGGDSVGDPGHAYVLGPLTGEHWVIYNKDFQVVDGSDRGDFTVDMMMYELPRDVAEHFYTEEPEGSRIGAAAMTEASGLGAIASWLRAEGFEVEIDDYCFAPCGYSCNVHAGDSYFIVHVTPEENCSFASFETNLGCSYNQRLDEGGSVSARLDKLIQHVLKAFQPGKFTTTLFVDQGAQKAVGDAPFQAATQQSPYRKRNLNSYHFGDDYVATVANYVRRQGGSFSETGLPVARCDAARERGEPSSTISLGDAAAQEAPDTR